MSKAAIFRHRFRSAQSHLDDNYLSARKSQHAFHHRHFSTQKFSSAQSQQDDNYLGTRRSRHVPHPRFFGSFLQQDVAREKHIIIPSDFKLSEGPFFRLSCRAYLFIKNHELAAQLRISAGLQHQHDLSETYSMLLLLCG